MVHKLTEFNNTEINTQYTINNNGVQWGMVIPSLVLCT